MYSKEARIVARKMIEEMTAADQVETRKLILGLLDQIDYLEELVVALQTQPTCESLKKQLDLIEQQEKAILGEKPLHVHMGLSIRS